MAYYGMNNILCRYLHYGKFVQFAGMNWCPVCETLRPGDPPVHGKLFKGIRDMRYKENRE